MFAHKCTGEAFKKVGTALCKRPVTGAASLSFRCIWATDTHTLHTVRSYSPPYEGACTPVLCDCSTSSVIAWPKCVFVHIYMCVCVCVCIYLCWGWISRDMNSLLRSFIFNGTLRASFVPVCFGRNQGAWERVRDRELRLPVSLCTSPTGCRSLQKKKKKIQLVTIWLLFRPACSHMFVVI